mmetsp:Transcript_56084/g.102597  ORF Transcript_56084/g.102597 Transcript_56084/m.102597 type:complete len:252 (-) Transcript_56084:265-1020(-)
MTMTYTALPGRSQFREDLLGYCDGSLYILIGVRQASEACLVLRGSQIDATLKHHPVPLGKLFHVTLGSIGKASHWTLREEEAKHTTDVPTTNTVACLPCCTQNAVDELASNASKVLIGAGSLELLQSFNASGHGKWVATKSTGLVHGSCWSNQLHDVFAPTIGANGQAPTDDLAHSCQIRRHTKVCLRTSIRDAEAGHHLIKDKECTILGGQLTDSFEKLSRGRDEARIANYRLQDHSSNLMLLQQCFNGL